MLKDIDEQGVYRLALAVFEGLDDDEKKQWLEVGQSILKHRAQNATERQMAKATHLTGRGCGNMDTTQIETNSRLSARKPLSLTQRLTRYNFGAHG